METHATTISNASAMPAATWHFLKMNDTTVEIPEGLAITPAVTANVPDDAIGSPGDFEDALAGAQALWEQEHPEPTAQERAELEEFLAAEADATYGGTAQSAYQIGADAIEEARSLALAFEHGTGDETAAYLRFAAGEPIVVTSRPHAEVNAQIIVEAVPCALSVAAIDVIASAHSIVNLSIVVGQRAQEATALSGEALPDNPVQPCSLGTTVRVFADAGSRVNVIRTQALGEGCQDIDDMGLFAAADARIDVRQTVLGATRTFTGLAGDLRGASSTVNVDTRYLGHGDQTHDFNYSLRHHGPKTRCNLQANGVLAGKSSKTLRGTIDLVRGCKGAEGSESETVLLVDEGVHNKTVPVILCNEDDVAGNHGATIGHIRDEQLFYLSSRGLSQEAAERMFVGAVLEQAVLDAPDETSRTAVANLGERLSPGFADLFEL